MTTNKNATKKDDRKSIKSVAEFTKWVEMLEGGLFLYRGLADASWDVETSALRRLRESEGVGIYANIPEKVFQDYITGLLERARVRGFGRHNGADLSDLELLAELQHYGAATCLIDFTINPLVALWFACNKLNKNGKVVAVRTDELEKFDKPNYEQVLKAKITDFLIRGKLCKWEPSDRNNRIIAQQSVFVFGRGKIETHYYEEIEIDTNNKKPILDELKNLGVTEETLFRDLPGFALSNAHDKLYAGYSYSAENYFYFGVEAQQRGENKKAIEYYNKVIELDQQFVEAYNNRGSAKVALRDTKGAIEDYNKSIELDPQYAEAYNNRGNAKVNLGRKEDAIKDYNKSIELDPQYAEAYNNRGNVKVDLGRKEDAIEDYNRSIELNPQSANAYSNRGNAKMALKNYQDAISDYDEAININPQFANAYRRRGKAKAASGDNASANKDFKKAQELEEQN